MRDSGTSRRFDDRFDRAIGRLPLAKRQLLVSFSGGLDSTLLLHTLWRRGTGSSLRAIHFDHGLHRDSSDWSAHCVDVADSLGIELITEKLAVERGRGESLEAVAREARYRALAEALGPGEVAVTAHHADDQLETVLLRLLRGTGVRGLTAIHSLAELGQGLLARPMLGLTRAEIAAEARRLGLEWLEDPSNRDTGFDRNFLRARILPVLHERWPKAGLSAERLARQMADAESVLGEIAAEDLKAASGFERLPIEFLTSLSEPRQNNALRHAIRSMNLPVPTAIQLAELRQALDGREDAETLVRWPGAEARVYRRNLYLQPTLEAQSPQPGRIDPASAFAFAEGELRLVASEDYGIPDRWARAGLDVSFRIGGERFRPHGSQHHKSLKQWFQEAGIVPWMRSQVPLLYHDDRLVAVADICLADDLPQDSSDGPFWRPVWSGHARLR